MHVVFRISIKLNSRRGPIFDVAGAMHYGKAVAIPTWAKGVALSDSVEISKRFWANVADLKEIKCQMYF